MKKIPHINTVMTAFPWHLDVSVTAEEAFGFMHKHGIHHIPVTRGGGIVAGIATRERVQSGVGETLAALMQPARFVDAHERLDKVLDIMVKEHCQVVVVLLHERLAGVFTCSDACRLYAEALRAPFLPDDGNDAA